MEGWYQTYQNVLSSVGWNSQPFGYVQPSSRLLADRTQRDLRMIELGDVSSEGSVDKLLLKLAATYLTGGEMSLFAGMMDSLKNPKNRSPLQLFNSIAQNSTNANFQVGIASCAFLHFIAAALC